MQRNDIPIISAIKRTVSVEQAGYVLYATLSGSHLYGFASEDSDYDYRGCYAMDPHHLLGLHRKRDVIEIKEPADIVLFEAKKEIRLALKGNCNVLEHINAIPVYSTPEFLQMRTLLNECWGRNGVYKSYRGMATFNYKKFISREGGVLRKTASPKKYLYVLRGLMAGIHALTHETIEPNIQVLNR